MRINNIINQSTLRIQELYGKDENVVDATNDYINVLNNEFFEMGIHWSDIKDISVYVEFRSETNENKKEFDGFSGIEYGIEVSTVTEVKQIAVIREGDGMFLSNRASQRRMDNMNFCKALIRKSILNEKLSDGQVSKEINIKNGLSKDFLYFREPGTV